MNFEDKTSFPGYIYFRDNERDYKIGLTNNLVVRGRAYKTENPRDTVVDCFSVETYAEAKSIEAEMKQAARAEGLCSFDNSEEWLERTDNTKAFWDRFVFKYAKKTHEEWLTTGKQELEAETTKLKNEVVLIRSKYDYQSSESSNLRYQLRKANLVIYNNSQSADFHLANISELEKANAELQKRFDELEFKASQLAQKWKQHRSLFLGQESSKSNSTVQTVVTDVLTSPNFEVTNLS